MSIAPPFDLANRRADFPILDREVNGKPLVYLDNGATSQKPRQVIDTLNRFVAEDNSNIHRGVHYLSVKATDAYDEARVTIAKGLNVDDAAQLIFTRGTTEGINLVASSWARHHLKEGDEILLTHMEHHANIVPWQFVADEVGAVIKVAPVTDEGALEMEAWRGLISPRTKVIAFTHISNVLGTINPVPEMCAIAREQGIITLVDGAQAAQHGPVDIPALGCDFYVFSGHKCFGPDGIGILYGRRELLEAMPPYQGGGDMVERVTFEKTTFKGIPEKYEAGTPNISGAIGLAAAFDYMSQLDWNAIEIHERRLLEATNAALLDLPGITIQGTVPGKVCVVSFTMDGIHPHDIGTILDSDGVAIRAGNHCAQPLMARYGIPSSARASFAFYNTLEEVEVLAKAVQKTQRFFG